MMTRFGSRLAAMMRICSRKTGKES
ncbi:hypothetical protein YQE_01458, partial [Dendroctonus ponderosae]